MSPALHDALDEMLTVLMHTAANDQRHTILVDLLWKLYRKDYHGVADCAMDLRELHL